MPATPSANRRPLAWWLSVAATLAIGAWFRLDQWQDQILIDDEWHAVHQLILNTPRRFLLSYGHSDHSIPLTAWDWLLMQTVGLSEAGMRLPLLLAGLASLVLLPWAMRGQLRPPVLLVFALLLAVSTLLIGYSRMARPYALTLLLSVWSCALLAKATAASAQARAPLNGRLALAAALPAGLAAWLHTVTVPFLLAPLLMLGARCWRQPDAGLSWRDWLKLTALFAIVLSAAVLPPLINDLASLTGKAGRDLPNGATLRGVCYIWLGTGSTAVVLVSLALAALGAGTVWRSGPLPRWMLLGLALTALAVLLLRPAWVFNPLTFGRYLLPALPLLLLCVAAGVVRVADVLLARQAMAVRHTGAGVLAASLAAATVLTSPQPSLLRHPNSNTLHYLYQFDYRARHNPVVAAFNTVPLSPFWATLATRPAGSVTVALAPFRFESYAWRGPLWEGASRQWVIPAYLSGGCEQWLYGEVPPDRRFAFRNAVHLTDGEQLRARAVDYVAFQRNSQVLDIQSRWRTVPACEAWLRQRFGPPVFEDAELLVWKPT